MTTAAVVLAAGRGVRAGGAVPKQYCSLGRRPVIVRALEAFLCASRYRCGAASHCFRRPAGLPRIRLRHWGRGPSRARRRGRASTGFGVCRASCADGTQPPEFVLIHDAARPFVDAGDHFAGCWMRSPDMTALYLRLGFPTASGRSTRAGCVASPWTGTGFAASRRRKASDTGPYSTRMRPSAGDSCFDDASVAARAGIAVACVPGDPANRKLTTPEDLATAQRALLDNRQIRIGQGMDVHAFGSGLRQYASAELTFRIVPALEGHSDADVGLHALADAIYGAVAEGDIGEHFPPDDPRWADCASCVFLRDAVDRAARNGFEPLNTDVTLVCELPRIAPHRLRMRQFVASSLGLPLEQVSVKATTTERLGFAGRGEGIAAHGNRHAVFERRDRVINATSFCHVGSRTGSVSDTWPLHREPSDRLRRCYSPWRSNRWEAFHLSRRDVPVLHGGRALVCSTPAGQGRKRRPENCHRRDCGSVPGSDPSLGGAPPRHGRPPCALAGLGHGVRTVPAVRYTEAMAGFRAGPSAGSILGHGRRSGRRERWRALVPCLAGWAYHAALG